MTFFFWLLMLTVLWLSGAPDRIWFQVCRVRLLWRGIRKLGDSAPDVERVHREDCECPTCYWEA